MKKVLLVLLILIVACAGFITSRPATYHVERSATIEAPGEVVYAQIADFHRWPAWSPWEHLDPNMKKTYSGADSGLGAQYAWAGNSQVGEGRMTITEADPGRKLGFRLEFLKPWKATNAAAFVMTPQGLGTRVTWSMDGTHDFMGKAMGLFMNMDSMIGKDFDEGLASLKTVSESAATAAAATDTSTGSGATTATP